MSFDGGAAVEFVDSVAAIKLSAVRPVGSYPLTFVGIGTRQLVSYELGLMNEVDDSVTSITINDPSEFEEEWQAGTAVISFRDEYGRLWRIRFVTL